jgi:hypothetical protein
VTALSPAPTSNRPSGENATSRHLLPPRARSNSPVRRSHSRTVLSSKLPLASTRLSGENTNPAHPEPRQGEVADQLAGLWIAELSPSFRRRSRASDKSGEKAAAITPPAVVRVWITRQCSDPTPSPPCNGAECWHADDQHWQAVDHLARTPARRWVGGQQYGSRPRFAFPHSRTTVCQRHVKTDPGLHLNFDPFR